MFCLNSFKQLTFFDQISELNHISYEKPVRFLQLLKEHFDLMTFIPESFYASYYSYLGKDRRYQLHSVLASLMLMHLFHIYHQIKKTLCPKPNQISFYKDEELVVPP